MEQLLREEELLLSDQEVLNLASKAERYLSSPAGQKALMEIFAMDLAHHGIFRNINEENTYGPSYYLEKPELFSITGFGAAIFIPELKKLFVAKNPFTQRDDLEKEVKQNILDFENRVANKLLTAITGDVAIIREDRSLRFFCSAGGFTSDASRGLEDLIHRGWLPLEWWKESYVITTENGQIEIPPGSGAAVQRFIEKFRKEGTFKRVGEKTVHKIILPQSISSPTS